MPLLFIPLSFSTIGKVASNHRGSSVISGLTCAIIPAVHLKVRAYISIVSALTLLVVWQAPLRLDLEKHIATLLILTLASFLSQIFELEILPQWYFSTNVAIATTAIFIGGLPLGIWVIALSTLPAEVVLRWDHLNQGVSRFAAPVLFNTCQLLLSVTAAATVYAYVDEALSGALHAYFAMGASFLAYFGVNNAILTGIIALDTGDSYFRILRTGIKNFSLQFLTMGSLAILMTTLYQVSAASLGLALVPLILVYFSASSYLRLRRESDLAFRQITELLAERDEYTGSHSVDVEQLSIKLACAVGLKDEDVEAVRAGAAIHDIGKIAIPDSILKKLGPLTDEEFETMKQHTIIGADIISRLSIYREVVPIVRHEHEHWDGSGYPDGLKENDIPIGARIIAVADVYSALTTDRPYRPPQGKPLRYTPEKACAILHEMAGGVLDPSLVPAFIRILKSSELPEGVETQSVATGP